jgi:dephospho-CoA kinase
MLKVGVTGGIGSGKSLICRLFALLGIPVYDSDFRAKWVMQHQPELQLELRTAFGQEAFDAATGLLNRAYLAQLVFNNPAQLTLLNSLVHPRVKQDFIDWAAAQQHVPYLIKEAALMYETEAHKQVDKMILVTAPESLRITRTRRRDLHRSESDIRAIMEKQLDDTEKLKRVDYVITNDEQQLVIPQVLAIHQQLLALAQENKPEAVKI